MSDSEHAALMSLPDDERRVLLLEQWVKEAEVELEQMIESNKRDDDDIAFMRKQVKLAAVEYVNDGDEAMFRKSKDYSELIVLMRRSRYTIGEIRKQRERVQWRRKQLDKMKRMNDEHDSSSSRSKN